jgi:hypothetical protein
MVKLTEGQVIQMMRDEYRRRLLETIGESDVFDTRGNNVLTPGLKIRHKDTNFEYTVDSIAGEEEGKDVEISLKLPDEPRFEPPVVPEDGVINDEFLGELDLEKADGSLMTDPTQGDESELAPIPGIQEPGSPDEDIFVIDQEEFEKEYEVT